MSRGQELLSVRNMTSHGTFGGSLENKVALITGATSGIGRATAVAFAKAGVWVVIGDIRERPVGDGVPTADVVRDIGGNVLFVETDVAQKSEVEALVRRTVQEFGRVDILVNNAAFGHVSSVEHTPDEVLRRLVEVNFFGVVYGVQAVLGVMRAQGSGHIINVSSGTAMLGLPYISIYAATKSAIMRFSESIRYELEDANIHVSVIFPDITSTDLAVEVTPDAAMSTKTVRSLNQQGVEQYGSPLRRLQSPEEVAYAVLACALRPRGAIYLSRRIRFHGLFRYLLPSAVDREARRMKASFQKLLEKVAKGDDKTEEACARQNFRITH